MIVFNGAIVRLEAPTIKMESNARNGNYSFMNDERLKHMCHFHDDLKKTKKLDLTATMFDEDIVNHALVHRDCVVCAFERSIKYKKQNKLQESVTGYNKIQVSVDVAKERIVCDYCGNNIISGQAYRCNNIQCQKSDMCDNCHSEYGAVRNCPHCLDSFGRLQIHYVQNAYMKNNSRNSYFNYA